MGSGGGGGGGYGGRNSIFNDDGPSFGNSFGGDQGSMRMSSSQVNPSLNRDSLQVLGTLPMGRGVCSLEISQEAFEQVFWR